MSYCSPNDVRNALAPGVWPVTGGETPKLTRTAADLADGQLNDAIREADTTIDSYLARRYTTPVAATGTGSGATTPEPVRTWSRNIAAYGATLTYRRGADLTETDPVVRRYRATMAELVAARDGKSALSIPSNQGSSGSANAHAPINPSGTMFPPSDFDLCGPSHLQGHAQFVPGIWIDRR